MTGAFRMMSRFTTILSNFITSLGKAVIFKIWWIFTASFHYAEKWRNIDNTDARFQDLHETWILYDEILAI